MENTSNDLNPRNIGVMVDPPTPINPEKCYIGTKVIRAMPMYFETWQRQQNKWQEGQETLGDGYQVTYEDGYKSWSPKEVFERCYREITSQEKRFIY